VSRHVCKVFKPEGYRILTRFMGKLIHEGFNRKAIVGMAHGTPVTYRNASIRVSMADRDIRHVIGVFHRALNGGMVLGREEGILGHPPH